jgi:hypothetical protein
MSVWTTKSLNKECNYIVIKHTLRGVNYSVQGVKFRDGYAVVEANSKTYNEIKKIPVLRNCEEYPLIYLRKLKFITRTADVRMIYGQDVYRKYIEVLEEELKKEKEVQVQVEEKIHIEESTKCAYRTEQGHLCEMESLAKSPSKHCKKHILLDPKLPELGYEVPKFLTKKERQELKDKISEKLR